MDQGGVSLLPLRRPTGGGLSWLIVPRARLYTLRGSMMTEREGNEHYAPFTSRAIAVIRAIPVGKVASYGQVAALAGSPNGARQIVRILHALSVRERLPWHRVIGGRGAIALPEGGGREEQAAALKAEGVRVDAQGRIDMSRHQWSPRFKDFKPG